MIRWQKTYIYPCKYDKKGEYMKKFLLMLCFLVMSFFCFSACNAEAKAVIDNANTYMIDANLNYQEKTLSATEVLKYKNQSQKTLNELKFHLHPNAFSSDADVTKAVTSMQVQKAYPNGFSEGNIVIGGVYVGGNELVFSIEDKEKSILTVQIPELQPGNEMEVQINFTLKIPNISHRFGYGGNTLNLGNWYPIVCVLEEDGFFTEPYSASGDPFYSDIANYNVSLTFDSNLKIAHTGTILSSTAQNNKITITASAKAVRDFAIVLSEKFDVVSADVGKTKVNYFYYNDTNYQNNLQTAIDALKTFNKMIGEYPYEVLNVVKANFLHGGMEYPMLVYVSDTVDNDEEYTKVIVHEIAHQWWYGVVGSNQIQVGWLDEGLAEFSTALFFEKNENYGITYEDTISSALSSYLLFCDVFREVYDNLDTSMNRSLTEFKTDTEYVYIAYVKGMLLFDAVRDVVGKNKMEKCLQVYYADNAMQFATPAKLIESFEKASKKDLKNFITSWIDGTVVLEQLNGKSTIKN